MSRPIWKETLKKTPSSGKSKKHQSQEKIEKNSNLKKMESIIDLKSKSKKYEGQKRQLNKNIHLRHSWLSGFLESNVGSDLLLSWLKVLMCGWVLTCCFQLKKTIKKKNHWFQECEKNTNFKIDFKKHQSQGSRKKH